MGERYRIERRTENHRYTDNTVSYGRYKLQKTMIRRSGCLLQKRSARKRKSAENL